MTIDDKIRDEKLQYDINREAAKISALSSRKIDNYEYLTDEEILPSDQRRVIEQVLKPNIQKLKIKDVIPENTLSKEAENELNKIKEIEKTVDRESLAYRMNELQIYI